MAPRYVYVAYAVFCDQGVYDLLYPPFVTRIGEYFATAADAWHYIGVMQPHKPEWIRCWVHKTIAFNHLGPQNYCIAYTFHVL